MTATQNTPRPTRSKSNGQWAVDGKDPLNGNEVFKQADDALNVRQRIIDTYSRQGFDSIPSDDLRGRFRWMGLYTQRKPGIDGGKTATLEPEELEDKYFMLRVRVDGGALTTEQLRVIAGISQDFARDSADITDRQNIQLHWIDIESVPEIWRRLEEVGLHTTEACGDCPRVVLGSPVAGIAADEIIDPTEQIAEIKRRFIGNPDFSNLPRKYKTALTGHPSLDVVHEINDISFVGVVHPELGPGYDLWVGGGLSTLAKFAFRTGAFVQAHEVGDVWQAVTSVFRDYGYRRLRNKARLKFLLADWGPEKFRQVFQDEYLGYELPDGPAPATPTRSGDHVGVHEQKDGNFYGSRSGRRPGERHQAGRARRRRGGGGIAPGPADAVPEGAPARRARRSGRGRLARPGSHRAAGEPERLPPGHHGLHGHRVLQAGDRRDQGARRSSDRAAGASAGRREPHHPDLAAHQRLPQLLRPYPDC